MNDQMKRQAALEAIKILKNTFQKPFKIGLGSGSTSEIFVDLLIKYKDALPKFQCIASSKKIYNQAKDHLEFLNEEEFEKLDIYIDGADEVALDYGKTLIKGGGGCLTREKILFTSAQLVVILVDISKLSHGKIGSYFKRIPVEMLSFGKSSTVTKIGLKGAFRCDFITDQGGVIFDLTAPLLENLSSMEICNRIKSIPAVTEVGIFPPPNILIIGHQNSAEVIYV